MILLTLLACSSAPGPGVLPDPTWVDEIATDPGRFEALLKADGRAGWIELHAGRPEQAYEQMGSPTGRRRVANEVADLYSALAHVHQYAAVQLAEGWADAPESVTQAAAHAVDCSAHAGHPPSLARTDGLEHPVYNPCTEAEAAAVWSTRGGDVEGLAGQIFGPIPFEWTGAHTSQGARDALAELRRRIELGRAGRPDSEGLARSLAADEIARVRTAVALAQVALDEGEVEYARSLLVLAHPAGSPAIGPTRPPILYADLARAELLSGNPRRALDWLAALGPESLGVSETVSDLAVLRGLSRVGDSKEE